MRQLADLENDALYEIVSSIQGFLYLDFDQRGDEYWEPDKPHSYGDLGEHVIGLLSKHDLIPQQRESVDGSHYVLYDFDSQQLVSATVYPCYADAANDAEGLDNVLIVPLDLKHKEPES